MTDNKKTPRRKESILASISFTIVLAGCGAMMGTPRTYLENSPIRVTEIHFDPSPDQGDVEYIEISNTGRESKDLSGWQVTGGGRISLPEKTVLQPGQAIVVCENVQTFKDTFGQEIVPVALFYGKLKRTGETVRVENQTGKVADEVAYDEYDSAVCDASDTGLSIHRASFNNDPYTLWKASEPTPGKWEGHR